MSRKFKFYIACIILLVVPIGSVSQPKIPGNSPQGKFTSLYTDPQTPTTASIARFGDFPVSYFSGRPEISIPLYSLSSRESTLPIALSYEPSGVLVNSLPGWAGQNWTFEAGGVITRKNNGKPDDRISPNIPLSCPENT